jgi:thioredoxin reductase
MNNRTENQQIRVAEYVIIGAGPAAICAIPAILQSGIAGHAITWIDPQFSVGEFGTSLSVGSSVPGNTAVESYQKVNQEIYKIVLASAPKHGQFEIDSLKASDICSLSVASKPLQHISNALRQIVLSVEGKVSHIETTSTGLKVEIVLPNGTLQSVTTKRAILATGATAKTLQLPAAHNRIITIDPNIAFIQTALAAYLQNNPTMKTVAVIGSSHSAALATMHLLQAGMHVKQFMNKEYKYASPAVAPNGVRYTMYDNTGLKGEVKTFTKKLMDDMKLGQGEFHDKLELYVGNDRQAVQALLDKHLSSCTHAVATIGYEPSNTLKVNKQPLSHYTHHNKTTEFLGVKGLFGIGVAFPQEIKAISGEVESAVGVGKFWSTVNHPTVKETWDKNHAIVTTLSQSQNENKLFKAVVRNVEHVSALTHDHIRSKL